jgi:hypothetical protein
MITRPELLKRLERLPVRLRVAFAAGCADRVLRVFELDCDPADRRPRDGLKFAWEFACGGQVSSAVDGARARVVEATPKIEERGDHLTAAMAACISVIAALDAILDSTPESATDAAFSALEAVQVFAASWTGPGLDSEARWQSLALELVESCREQGPSQSMFSTLNDDPPAWFV